VKLSAPYRISTRAPAFSDVAPLAKAIIDANRERVLWGSDWPHPDSSRVPGRKPADIAPLLNIDDGLLLNQLAMWAPDENILRKILVDNPERLYQF
jgi:predicted TIM-barrel fold metal-dependent hydrolase